MDELRSWWEVPSIAHFCSLFRTAFDLTDFDIEDLEEALLESQREEGSEFVTDLVCRLLNGCYSRKDVTILNYDLYIKDLIKYKWDGTGNPIAEKTEFKQLTLREKVELLHAVCEYRLDADDVPERLKGFEGDNMRVEPLGRDKDGCTYWYFYGSRLYKEDPPPKKEVSKEEKRANDKQRKKELEKKRKEDKKQKRIDKKKQKTSKKGKKVVVKAPKPVEEEEEDDGNIRRSGRLRIKKELKKFASESSESSSSEDETEESSSEEDQEEEEDEEEEEEEVEPEPERQTNQKGSKKTPAKKTPSKKAPAKKTPAKKQEYTTPSRTPRQSARQRSKTPAKTPNKASVEETPEIDDGVRRSGRIRKRSTFLTPSRRNDSDSEEEIKEDSDSGHESGITDDDDDAKSETSKISVKSSVSKSSQQVTPLARKITLPRASAHLQQSSMEDDDTEEEKNEAVELKEVEKVEQDDEAVDQDKTDLEKDNSQTEGKEVCASEATSKETDSKEDKAQVSNELINNVENDGAEKSNDSNVTEMEIDKEKEVESESNSIGNTLKSESSYSGDDCKTKEETTDLENKSSIEMEIDDQQNTEVASTCTSAKIENESKTLKISESNENGKETPELPSEKIVGNKDQNAQDPNRIPEGELKNDNDLIKEADSDNVQEGTKSESDKNCLETEIETNAKDENEVGTDIKNEVKDETISAKIEMEEPAKDVEMKIEDDSDTKADEESEMKEKTVKLEVDEGKEDIDIGTKDDLDEDEMETEDKEIESSGPKTTLGKHKTFTSVTPVPPTPSKSDTRWHLICSTYDDWVNLGEWFSSSQVRCEKMLVKLINEDFLPVLPEIIEAREKERRKRLQELEVRRSNRITHRMKEKMEQGKILAEAFALEEQEKTRTEEERRLKEEQQRLEDENRLREERVRAREERSKRLSMREERARLKAEGKEIPPELLYTATNKYNDDYESDDSRCDLKSDEDYRNLSRLVDAMKIHKDCWPFLEAVTDEVAPGYSDVIKRPMDLSKIEEKVKKREYKSTQHFMSDFRLMFNNCKRFNGPDSEFTECARTMETILKKYKKRFLTDDHGDTSYYRDKDFTLSVKGVKTVVDKKFRPRRAASSRAMETVHRALNSSDEESDSEEEDELEPLYKGRKSAEFPAQTPSHQSLLLQEMIEMKRQREKNLAASALQNHQIITRGPERIRIQNPQGGVTIMSKGDLPTKGLLKLASTREIKRKVNPQFGDMVDLSKKDPGLSVTSNTMNAGLGRGKTIRIVAPTAPSAGSGNAVKDTAESVKVSADGYLIIGGKNSGIKVSENTKIVIQPPGTAPPQPSMKTQGRELIIKKIPTPSGLKELPVSNSPNLNTNRPTILKTSAPRTQAIINASNAAHLYSPTGNLPTVVTQHQIMNKGLNSSSGIVTQNPNNVSHYPSTNQINPEQEHTIMVQRRQQLLQRQHNGTEGQCTPPKMIRLSSQTDPAIGNPSHMSIEDRLREPSIDKVSENVVKSVNIAGDILESYYSVFNSNETEPQPVNNPAATGTVKFPHETQTVMSPDIKSLLLKTVVNNKSLINVNASSPSYPSASPNGSLLQTPVRQFNTHQTLQNNVATVASSNIHVVSNAIDPATVQMQSVQPDSGRQSEHFHHVISVSTAQMPSVQVENVLQGFSHNRLLNSQQSSSRAIQNVYSSTQNVMPLQSGLSNATISPIEALFTGNLASNDASSQLGNRSDQIVQLQSVSASEPSIQSEFLKPVPNNLRQNVFDMFGGTNQQRQQSSSVNDNNIGGTGPVPLPVYNTELLSRDVFKGARAPSSSTVNFGSPLKTLSVMEALKSKLAHPAKPEQQLSIISKITGDMSAMEVTDTVVSYACEQSNPPVVTSVFTSQCSQYTHSYPSTSTSYLSMDLETPLDTVNSCYGTETEHSKESTKEKGHLDIDHSIGVVVNTQKKDPFDQNKESTDDSNSHGDYNHGNTSDIVDKRLEAKETMTEGEQNVTKHNEDKEVVLCTYKFNTVSNSWEKVKNQCEYIPSDLDKIQSNKGNEIIEETNESLHPNGSTNKIGHFSGDHTDKSKYRNIKPDLKGKSMYVIMIPNSGNSGSEASMNKLAAELQHVKRLRYPTILPKKMSRTEYPISCPEPSSKRRCRRRDSYPPDIKSILIAKKSLPVAPEDKTESQIKTMGKVHFTPSSRSIFKAHGSNHDDEEDDDDDGAHDNDVPKPDTMTIPWSNPVGVSNSAPDLSFCYADGPTRDSRHVMVRHRYSHSPLTPKVNDNSDIEQYLNQIRARQKAFRVTTDPIKTYQLAASTQKNAPVQNSPKCMSLKDLDCFKAKPALNQLNNKIGGQGECANKVKGTMKGTSHLALSLKRAPNNRKKYKIQYSNPNSYLVKRCLQRDSNNDLETNDLDNSLTCDEDFFTSEVLSNLFPSNLGVGDSESDSVFNDIEHDLFDLQDNGHSLNSHPWGVQSTRLNSHTVGNINQWSAQSPVVHQQIQNCQTIGAMMALNPSNPAINNHYPTQTGDPAVRIDFPAVFRGSDLIPTPERLLTNAQQAPQFDMTPKYVYSANNSSENNKPGISLCHTSSFPDAFFINPPEAQNTSDVTEENLTTSYLNAVTEHGMADEMRSAVASIDTGLL